MKMWRWMAAAAMALPAAGGMACPAAAQQAAEGPAPRHTVMLADGWRFKFGAPELGPEAADFADQDWASVAVPHSWNRVGYYLPDPERHIHRAETVDRSQGIGWYRLRFTAEPDVRGKRVWLEFDAASRIAKVWLNGVPLGEHQGGFSRFRFDATQAIRAGAPNILTVRVDNSEPRPGSTTADVLPLRGDFFVHGGLYRPVRMIVTDPVHIDMLDHGGPGVYAATTLVGAARAEIGVSTRLSNDSSSHMRLTVVTRLLKEDGQAVAEASERVTLAASAKTGVSQRLVVLQPHLWQGVEDPYLYRLVTDVRDARGRTVDRVEQAFGIREMRADPEKGFLLNGKPLRLHGVGLHQDREGKGWATTPEDIESDFALLREMGVNTLRLTHYQHGQPIHDLADRYGFVLWDEIPLVSAWTQGDSKEATPALRANARQQLIELIRQNGNHPSVATWGIANEVDFGNSLPIFLTGGTGSPPDPVALLAELNTLAKQEDPLRPTALATCCEGGLFKPGTEVPITAPAADLGGANRYFGWYFGTPEQVGPQLDMLRAKRPAQPLSVTEYGAGGATTIHTDNVLGGPVDARGRDQPEEYQSYVHEENWRALSARQWLWATWLWNGFDFASTVRTEGDARDINTKGLITFDRAIRKDAFYFYKANWSDAPTVHVNGRRYVDRAYAVTDVRVYSNAPRTELVVNGVSAGAMADCPLRVCVWKNVRLAGGANDVIARGAFATSTVEDAVRWQLPTDAGRAVRIDSGALVAAAGTEGRFGSDNFFVGGTAATLDTPADYGKPPKLAAIGGTGDRGIAATYRKGSFAYRVPLVDGRYEVALTFVEPDAKTGERIFDVLAGDRTIVDHLDVSSQAKAPMTALRRSATVMVKGGMLDLAFRPVKGEAIVSGVEIRRVDR